MRLVIRTRAAITWQLSRICGNILFVILARRSLNIKEFGYMTVALSFGVVVLFILVGGLDRLMVREVARDKARGAAFLLPSLVYQLFVSAILLTAIPFIASKLHLSQTEKTLMYLSSLASISLSITILLAGFHIGIDRFRNVVFIFVPANIFLVVGSLLFLWLSPSVIMWMALWLGSRVVILVSAVVMTLRFWVKPEKAVRLQFLRVAVPLSILYVSSVLLFQTDTLALRRVAGPSVVGIYQEAFRIVIFPLSFISSLTLPYLPMLAVTAAKSAAHRRDWTRMTLAMLFAETSAAVLLLLFRNPLLWIAFGHTYAAPLIPSLLGFLIMRVLYSSYFQFFILNGPAFLCSLVSFGGCALSWFLTTRYASVLGPVSAAAASFAAHTAVVIILAIVVLLLFDQHPFSAHIFAVILPLGLYIAAFPVISFWLQILLAPVALLLSFFLLPRETRKMLVQIPFFWRRRDVAGHRFTHKS